MQIDEYSAAAGHHWCDCPWHHADPFSALLHFPDNRPTPPFVRYLGRVLPAAVFGMQVVYCLKDIRLFTGSHGLPELIAVFVVIALHLWKRQMLLSIAVGTFVYMCLVQLVFPGL